MQKILIILIYIFAAFNFSTAQENTHNSQNHSHHEKCDSEDCQNSTSTTHNHLHEDDAHCQEKGHHKHSHENRHEHSHEEHHDHSDENHDHQHNFEIQGLKTITIRPSTFIKTINTSGIIKVLPASEQVIIAKSNGIVTFSSPDLMIGTDVNKDEKLFEISGQNLVNNNPDILIIEAKNKYQQSLESYQRAKSLISEKIISRQEFLSRKSDFQADSLRYSILMENFDSEKLFIRSPMTGKLFELLVKNGDYVSAGDKLAVISRDYHNYLEVNLPKKYYSRISTINSGQFRTEYCSEIHSFNEHEKLSQSRRVQIGNPFIQMNFSLAHNHDLLPGSFAEVWLDVEKCTNTMVIPKSAIIEQQGLYFVFVKHSDSDYHKTQIDVISMNAEEAQIASGLHFGDDVVIEGVLELKLSQSASKIDPHAGHNHAH